MSNLPGSADPASTPPPPSSPPPTPEQIARLKKLLLKKGAEINEKLVALLNGQQVRVDGVFGGKPGEKPIERLRRFMAIIETQLAAIRAGTYGKCERCGDGLPYAHLEQVPWIDTCQKCAKELAEANDLDKPR